MASWSKSSHIQCFLTLVNEEQVHSLTFSSDSQQAKLKLRKGNTVSNQSQSNVLSYTQGNNGRYLRHHILKSITYLVIIPFMHSQFQQNANQIPELKTVY